MAESTNGARPAGERRLSVTAAVRRRPLLVLGVPVLLVALTVLFVMWIPPVYETSTDVRIDEESSGVPALEALQSLSQGSQVATEMAVLRSRSLAEQVTRDLALQLTIVEPGRTLRSEIVSAVRVDSIAPAAQYGFDRMGTDRFRVSASIIEAVDAARPFARPVTTEIELGEAVVGEPFAIEGGMITLAPAAAEHERIVLGVETFPEAVTSFRETLVVARPDREANVVNVRFRGRDPELVQAVANVLAARFIESRQDARSAGARSTVVFLDEQLAALTTQLGGSEQALREFREANAMVSVEDEAGIQVERLADMKAQRDLLDAERSALRRLMEEVRAQADGAGSPYRRLLAFPSLFRNALTGELLGQLAALENEVSVALVGRTPQDRDVQLQLARIAELDTQLQTIAETYLEGLDNQVASFDAILGAFQEDLARIPAAQMTYVRLRREADLLAELYTELQMRQKEAEILAAIRDETVRVVDPAPYPREPVVPRPWTSLLVAAFLGPVLGISGAIAREHSDRSIRDRADLGRVTGAAVLGLIPELAGAARNGRGTPLRPRLVPSVRAGDPAVEAYLSLHTNLLFSSMDRPPGVIAFSSPLPGDGKSTTAVNLAVVLARQGERILLIDADLRRGALHETLGSTRDPGLTDVLFERATFDTACRQVEPRPGARFDFLPSGTAPANPAEVLGSNRMLDLLREVREKYRLVILDAPPINLVTDAALLGRHCDGIVLVARVGVTEEAPLQYAVEQIDAARARLIGTVLNAVSERRPDYYGSKGGANAYFRKS